MEKTTAPEATVYYNGACPVCRGLARRHRDKGTACWRDVQAGDSGAQEHGIEVKDVERRLHLVAADGVVLRGYAAMRRLDELSGRKPTSSRVLAALQRMNVEFWSWLLFQFNRLRK